MTINLVDASVPGQLYMVCCRNLFLTPITPILGMQHLCCLCEIQAHPTNPVEMYATGGSVVAGLVPATSRTAIRRGKEPYHLPKERRKRLPLVGFVL